MNALINYVPTCTVFKTRMTDLLVLVRNSCVLNHVHCCQLSKGVEIGYDYQNLWAIIIVQVACTWTNKLPDPFLRHAKNKL